MDITQSPDRQYVHEAIEHVAELGYLTLIERRALLRNTIKILKQSHLIDEQPLPADDQTTLRATTAEFLSVKEQVKAVVITPGIGKGLIGILKRRATAAEPKPAKKHWYNNGKINKMFPIEGSVSRGWKPGRIHRRRMGRPPG